MVYKEEQGTIYKWKGRGERMESESNGGRKINVEELDGTRGEGCNYRQGKKRGGECYIWG